MKKLGALPLVLICLCTLMLLCESCSQRMMDFTIISSKNINISNPDPNYCVKVANIRVKGKDSKSIILLIPMGTPNLKSAVDKAIEQYPGAVALSDGVIYYKYWNAIFFGKSQYEVEGTPVYPSTIDNNSTTTENHNYYKDNSTAKEGHNYYNDNGTATENHNYPKDNTTTTENHNNKNPQSEPQYKKDALTMYLYMVKAGDTISSIAKAYGVSVSQIIDWNNLGNNGIEVGKSIAIYK